MSDIQLNFINNANDVNNSEIVIFQKNQAETFDELAVAWRVIKNCGTGDNHPFTYPMEMYLSAKDSWGNYTPKIEANNGEVYEMIKDTSGDVLRRNISESTSMKEIDLKNSLTSGSISANIYKDGKLLASKPNVVPGQKAVFELKPVIYVGVASNIVEGVLMDSAVISSINTKFSLLGVRSADIVMTGGGSGNGSSPYSFELENVVMA